MHQEGRGSRAEPQCYLGLDEPGSPLPFAFYAINRQQVTETDHGARFQNRAKCATDGLGSPERVLGPKRLRLAKGGPLPRSGSVQQIAGGNRRWRLRFRCRGSRRESAAAQLPSLDGKPTSSTMMTISWTGAIGTALGTCVIVGPFVYSRCRSNGDPQFRSILEVALVFVLLVLWIVGGSNALYGLGYVVDQPPQILGSGALDQGRSHMEHLRVPNLGVGLVLMAAAWTIGALFQRRE